MIYFIVFLRFLATCLITNAHYTGIYPNDIIANGGLLGDVIFFAVSGYCLYNVKQKFHLWYGKRLIRCYLQVFLITSLFLILGFYSFRDHNFLWWFIYPTYYHFVSSIIILYIPYYIIMKIQVFRNKIPYFMLGFFVVFLIIYFAFYDKSYYHIDNVREPIIRILFMESMLLGAWFRKNDDIFRNKFKIYFPFITIGLFVVYFITKYIFSNNNYVYFQFINQIVLIALLYFVFRTFIGLDSKLEGMPNFLKSSISFIAKITLEIYVVQYVLIDLIRPLGHFPLNWIVLTCSILLAGIMLHYLCKLITFIFNRIVICIKNKKEFAK